MLIEETKDITTVERGIILHGVNCQGVMGSGVAGAIRKKWPIVFREYQEFCKINTNLLGEVNLVSVTDELWVFNGFTQEFYGNDGRVYADKYAVLSVVKQTILYAYDLMLPIYMPRIGCGLGGLNWDNLKPEIEQLSEGSRIASWNAITVCNY